MIQHNGNSTLLHHVTAPKPRVAQQYVAMCKASPGGSPMHQHLTAATVWLAAAAGVKT
jgi:hypothetical protein